MAVSDSELTQAWRAVLELSKVHAGETVCLLVRPNIQVRNLEAAEHALREIGVFSFKLEPLMDKRPLRDNRIAMDALKASQMVIDFMGLHLLRRNEQDEVVKAGTRVLYVVEPPDALVRLMPTADDKRRVRNAEAILRGARSMHIASKAGTDLTVDLGEYPILSEWGYRRRRALGSLARRLYCDVAERK